MKDKFNNPYLIWTYQELTKDERFTHFENVGKALLKHKFHYYLDPDHTLVSDAEYDYMERYYEAIAHDLGLQPEIVNMVGFNVDHPWSKELMGV